MNHKIIKGGGADSNLAPNSSKNIFKPLIASSLALALGVSVLSAENLLENEKDILKQKQTKTVPTQAPSIKVDNSDFNLNANTNIGTTDTKAQTIQWESGSDGLVYLTSQDVATANSNDSIIKNLELKFASKRPTELWTGNNGTLAMFAGIEKTSKLEFNSQGNGIQLGTNGDGQLKLQFATDSSISPETYVHLVFNNTQGDLALKGNLLIVGGVSNINTQNPNFTPQHNYDISFTGDVQGNIIQAMYFTYPSTDSWAVGWTPFGSIVFHDKSSNPSSLIGNLDVQLGGIDITLDAGRIEGNVSVYSYDKRTMSYLNIYRNTGSDIAIGIDSATDLIKGNLTLSGNGRNAFTLGYKDEVNTGSKVITFNPDAKQTDGTTARIALSNGEFSFYNMKALKFVDNSSDKKTFTLKNGTINSATFQFDRAVLSETEPTIITGNLAAQDGKSIRLSLIDDPSIQDASVIGELKTLKIDGSITIENGGLSLFYNDRLDCFEAKVQASSGIDQRGGYIGRNDAFFDAGTFTDDNGKKNISTIQGTSGGISHLRFNDTVEVDKGIGSTETNGAELYFYKGVTINAFDNTTKISDDSIGSAIYGGGNNTIYLGNTNTIIGNIIANSGKSNALTLGNQSSLSITGNLRTNAGTNSILQEQNKTATLTLNNATIRVEGGAVAKNIINVDNLTIQGTSSLIAAGNQNSTNTNTITANTATITLQDITVQDNNNNKNTLQITSGTLSVTGSISTTAGTNAITIKSSSSTNTISGQVNASGNGKNVIEITSGNSTITGNITANNASNIINTKSSSLTLGTSTSSRIAMIRGNGGGTAINTIEANTITAYINEFKLDGNHNAQNKNTLTANSGNIDITSVSATGSSSAHVENINAITLASGNLTIGSMSADQYGVNNISFGGTGIINGDITTNGNNAKTNFTLISGTATLTLNGKTQAVANETTTKHDITSLTATASGTNTLTLDNTNPQNGTVIGAMETTIHSITNGSNLDVVLKGQSGKGATLILDNATGTTLRSVSLGSSSSDNAITFSNGANKILTAINAEGSKLTINLQGARTSLNLAGGLSGGAISVSTTNGVLSGGAINGTTLTLADGKALTLQNTNAVFTTVDASTTNGATLTIGAGNTTTINTLNDGVSHAGSKLTVGFNGNANQGAKLSILNDSDNSADIKNITLKAVSVADSSTNNTLDLSSLSTVGIGSAVSLADGTGLTLKLKDTNLAVEGGTDSRINKQDAKGALTISVDSGLSSTSTATSSLEATTNGSLNITSLDMVGEGTTKVTFKSNTTIGTLNAQANGGNELVVGKASQDTKLSIGTTNSTLTSVELKGDNATLEINGGKQSIGTLTTGATDKTDTTKGNILSFANNTISIGEISNTNSNQINLTLDNSTLSLGGVTNAISSLTANHSLIDMAMTDNNGRPRARSAKTLEIGANNGSGFKGNATFEVYTNGQTNGTDSITFTKAEQDNGTKSVATIVASGDINTILNGDGKTLKVAVVDDTNAKDNLEVVGGKRLIGGVVVTTVLTPNTDSTEYYLGRGVDEGAPVQYQAVASSALTVNYDLFLANFNSLNKRMGELRENPHSNGVWARVFGGNMSNDFGSGSKTDYVTAQAGYDYGISVGENVKNYVGVAIAYGKSWTKGNTLSMNGLIGANGSISLSSVDSSMVEVGIYNSYVADSGWYNDTIFKFDYIMSEFALSNKSDLYTDTSNFAMILSDEFGYRYKFAENEKGNWYIDPQVEVAFGYFNQSDFNRAMYDTSGAYQSTMQATQDTILTLRTRAGLSLGKKFNTERGFASLYIGAFYEYDYIDGGNANVAGRVGGTTTAIDSLESNGRAMLNVGSNIGLTESARLYIDVEKSFGDKQRTFMQFNLGARYSF